MLPVHRRIGSFLLVALAGCAGRVSAPQPAMLGAIDSSVTSAALPPTPRVRGALALRVVYPLPGQAIRARDSSFLFGSAGTGDARLTINGHPVRVWPNGAWLAWIPFPADSVMRFRLQAWTAEESAALEYELRRPGVAGGRVARGAAWVDSTSLTPRGRLWLPPGEYLPLSVRATPGATVRLRLPDGTLVPLAPHAGSEEVPAALRGFDRDTMNLRTALRQDRYVGVIRGRALGPDPGPLLPMPEAAALAVGAGTCAGTSVCQAAEAPGPVDTLWPLLEVARGLDTVRAPWPVQVALLDTLPRLVELDDDPMGLGTSDSLTVGRAAPGGSYHWFFPTGTRVQVGARVNGNLRVRLSPSAEAWVAAAEARPLPRGVPPSDVVVGAVSLTPLADRVVVRVPLGRRIPFQVSEAERSLTLRLYGAVGDVDWIRYGPRDSLVRRVGWTQAALGEVALTFDLAEPVWGYRARWSGGDLLLELRRPPAIDRGDPLRGRLIAVDPGHPPAGAVGPTGLREAEANLAVALRLRELLEAEGARVLLTRSSDSAVDLWPRVKRVEAVGAELLVSIHNNALPDGVNPFTNNGTSVYYNQPRSISLAAAIQRALVQRLGLRDLGIGRGDLALARPTWMPAVLCEGLFMMIPDQEAALRSPQGRELYAQGVLEGIRTFLRDRARQ